MVIFNVIFAVVQKTSTLRLMREQLHVHIRAEMMNELEPSQSLEADRYLHHVT